MLNHITHVSHTFGPRATERVHIYPQAVTRGRSLVFPDEWIKGFTISEVFVAGKPQKLRPQPAPNPENPVTNWKIPFDVAQVGDEITLVVTNDSDLPRVFQGAFCSDILQGEWDAFTEIAPELPPPPPPAHQLSFAITGDVSPSASSWVKIEISKSMVVRKIEVPDEIASYFIIDKFELNGVGQFGGHNDELSTVPAIVFSSKAVEITPLDIEASTGDLIEIQARNFSDTPMPFCGTLYYDDLIEAAA